jgi:hypothetical protein
MTMQALLPWLADWWVVLLIAGMFTLGLIGNLTRQYGVYCYYFGILGGLLAAALMTDRLPYFFAFSLGMATAFAEIISKFSDEPLKALKTMQAVLYHVLNGAISALALWFITINGEAEPTTVTQVMNVFTAGLGSMLLMRSKLFNIKTDAEDISFGPDQIIKIYFRFMEAAIDRVRALDRMRLVKEEFDNKAFEPLKRYSITMLAAAQALEEDERRRLENLIAELDADGACDEQLKSYRLGFELLNRMGEDFVKAMLEGWDSRWLIQAPLLTLGQNRLARLNPFAPREEQIPYFAYADSMRSRRFLDRLNLRELDEGKLRELARATPAIVRGYRLAFNRPQTDGATVVGMPNLVPDPTSRVEGVLYMLSRDVLDFLDKTETGYERCEVSIEVREDGAKLDAQTYVGTLAREGLPPHAATLESTLAGAEEHALSLEYIDELRTLGV